MTPPEMSFEPELVRGLRNTGFALLEPHELASDTGIALSELDAWRASWSDLPSDPYLRDGGHYRSRRHACFVHDVPGKQLEQTPPRAHWQPTSYNALHGGLERWFEPMQPAITQGRAWSRLLRALGERFAALQASPRWFIEAHQFRIDTAEGIGRPTPEGAHRDGVDFVAVILVNRHDVRGGETRVFQAEGQAGLRFTMHAPWTTLLLDDARVIHETTPIQPDQTSGVRDTLVLTYRAQGFQEPVTSAS